MHISKKPLIIKRIAIIVVVLLLLLYVEYNESRSALSAQKLQITQELSEVTVAIEASLQKNIELVKGLATYLIINPQLSQDDYSLFVKELLKSDSNIRVLAASDAYIVRYLYPLEGNEAVFGMDYRSLEEQLPTIERALALKEIILAGPLDLVQGGRGLIARLPIRNGFENWGILSAVINYDTFLQDLNLDQYTNIDIAIRGKDALGENGEVFLGDPELFNTSKIKQVLKLPNGEWIIAAAPKNGWTGFHLHWQFAVAAFAVIAFILYNMQLRLKNEDLSKTSLQDLQASEEKFRNFFNQHNANMLIVNEFGRIVDINAAAEAFYGKSRKSLIGRSLDEVRSDQSVSLKKLPLTTQNNSSIDDLHVAGDGEVREVEIFATSIEFEGKSHLSLIVSDVTDKRHYQEKLEYLAHYDNLTGLPNRAKFIHTITNIENNSAKSHSQYALLFLDLDRFKIVNDSLGHAAGDELLRKVSERLAQQVRNNDILARLGGDEFVILVKDYHDEQALKKIASNFCEVLQHPFFINDGIEVNLGSSVGIAQYPHDANSIDELLMMADASMYKAKQLGSNSIVFYDKQISIDATALLTINNEIKRAVANDEFEILLQPQVDIATGALKGAEALIRWNHPEKGFLTPYSFIPLAESTGAIRLITPWVLKKVVELAQKWRKSGYEFDLSFNVSAVELSDANLYDTIKAAVSVESNIAKNIVIEIVESSLVENIEFTRGLIMKLRDDGFRIAIDDFGIGFSSLSYLSQLPVDILKIDRAFINEITKNEQLNLVKSIIDLANNFNLSVTAEGIETPLQAEILQELKCPIGQGYLYSKPIPVADFEAQYLM